MLTLRWKRKVNEDVYITINSENNYEKSVKNYNILTEKMNDDFISYRVEQDVLIWLNEKGVLGEIECIFPSGRGNDSKSK